MLSRALSLLVPPVCVACGAAGHDLCARCRRVLPWLEPPQCRRCALPGRCTRHTCPAAGAAFARAWAPVAYEGTARAVVLALKTGRARVAAEIMAAQLAVAVRADLPTGTILVPVPAHPRRARTRGFDHAAWLAVALGRRCGLAVQPCLRRVLGGPRQMGAGRRERLAGGRVHVRVQGAAPQRALLVDDVHTTGATLRACASALRDAGTEWVGVATYARTIAHVRVAPGDKRRSAD